MTELFPLGEVPQNLGEIPRRMLAWCIRPDREGDPDHAMRLEEVEVPPFAVFRAAAGEGMGTVPRGGSDEDD